MSASAANEASARSRLLTTIADALDSASAYLWEVRVDGVTHLRTNRALSAKRWIQAARAKQPFASITLNGVEVNERKAS